MKPDAAMQVQADTATGAHLRAWVETELTAAIHQLGARGGRIHAGVHQARKAIRRARAALLLAGPVLGAGAGLVERELRRVNHSLSALRDAHALVGTLERLALKSRDHDETLLLRRAHRIAAAARAAAARDPVHLAAVVEARACLAVLVPALAGLPWDAVTAARLVDVLADTQHRVARLRARAVHGQDDEAWHRWRRWMRRQSQQRRACAAVGVEVPDTGFDKSLAEQLGVMQDLSLLIAHCRGDSLFAKPDRGQLRRFAERALQRQRKRLASVAEGD